jgi:hypothetical protein
MLDDVLYWGNADYRELILDPIMNSSKAQASVFAAVYITAMVSHFGVCVAVPLMADLGFYYFSLHTSYTLGTLLVAFYTYYLTRPMMWRVTSLVASQLTKETSSFARSADAVMDSVRFLRSFRDEVWPGYMSFVVMGTVIRKESFILMLHLKRTDKRLVGLEHDIKKKKEQGGIVCDLSDDISSPYEQERRCEILKKQLDVCGEQLAAITDILKKGWTPQKSSAEVKTEEEMTLEEIQRQLLQLRGKLMEIYSNWALLVKALGS